MTFLFSVTIPHIAYACLGGFVVFFGMFSLFIRERLYIGEACWAFLFGVIVGPYGAGIFDPRGWGGHDPSINTTDTITLEVTRVVLAIGVFAIGVELPKAYMARHWKSLAFLLVPVMTWGWFVSAGLIYALIPGLSFLSSLVVAACLTPTDPILAAAVVGGRYADKHVPAHLRHLLAAESGCNDGAAFPFLFIGLYLVLDKNTGSAVKDWFLLLWLYQIILGVVIGALIGFGFRHLMKFCERKDLIDRQSYVAQYVSLALLTIGVCTMLGSDDLLAAFSCGTAFAWDGFFNKQTEASVFSSVIDLLFNVAAFVFVGAWMPFGDFNAPELTISVWRLIVIALLILLLRRLPIMIALYKWIPDVKTFREAVFSGHFGPIGIGAVFISTLAAEQLPRPSDPPANQAEVLAASIQPIVAFMVLCSIAVHGLSIPFFSLGRRVHSVHREWSRRSTSEAPPDWITHTRRAERGSHIIVNRDDNALERGEAGAREHEGEVETDEKKSERETTPSDEGTLAREKEARIAHGDPTEAQTKENAPDGDDTVHEWKEGPHRVVERRGGPGEEVEVEVQKNAFTDEETLTSIFRGKEHQVQHATKAYMDKIKAGTHDLEQGAERFVQEVERRLSPEVAESSRRTAPTTSVDDNDDEGWQSDVSAPGGDASSFGDLHRSASPALSGRPHAHGKKRHGLFSHTRGGRRRNSMRRGHSGTALVPADTPPADPPSPADEPRGRAAAPPLAQTPSQLRTRDLERLLRTAQSSRAVSPARSVRFASGTNTPRHRDGTMTPRMFPESMFPDSPGTPGSEDVDSPRHVMFELPRPPRG